MSVTYTSTIEEVLKKLREISPILEESLKKILDKPVDKLTPPQKRLLILARYLISHISEGRDIRTRSKPFHGTVIEFLRLGVRGDVEGVDTPDALPAYNKIKYLLRIGDYKGLVRFIVTGK